MKNRVHVFDGSELYFTSDTHFYHNAIIDYCVRPYGSAEIMNEMLIQNWNSKVSKDDHIFHLGDFAFGGVEKWRSVIERLNGHIHLVLGNHDIRNIKSIKEEWFDTIEDIAHIAFTSDKTNVVCSHYPLLTWQGIEKGVINAYGHWHTTKNHLLESKTQYSWDVGVDNNNYVPISYDELVNLVHNNGENITNV